MNVPIVSMDALNQSNEYFNLLMYPSTTQISDCVFTQIMHVRVSLADLMSRYSPRVSKSKYKVRLSLNLEDTQFM